jgi:hypothetical protein
MTIRYKLWLEIERIDDERDEYERDPEPHEVAIRWKRASAEALRQRILDVFGEIGD